MNSDQIFGKLNPYQVNKQFDLEKIFSKGMNAESYDDDFERGSSADWNDNSEFKSNLDQSPTRKTPFSHSNFKAMQEAKSMSMSAGPFGLRHINMTQTVMRPSHITEEDPDSKSKAKEGNVPYFAPLFQGGSFGGQSLNQSHQQPAAEPRENELN